MMRGRVSCAASLLLLFGCSGEVWLGSLPTDAGPEPDAGHIDAGQDAGQDAGHDAGHDAGTEDTGPPPPPPPPPPLPADGRYQLSFVPGPDVACEGSLEDIHDRFIDMLPEQVDLHDGEIEVKRLGSVLDVWGAPIERGYSVPSLRLQETDTMGVFLGWTERFGLGPEGTRETLARFRMDVEVPAPLPPETTAQIRYVAGTGPGECLISFRAVLTRK